MVDVLRLGLSVLLVVALATVIAYVLAFFALAAWTLIRGSRADLLAEELDSVLDEILAPAAPAGTNLRHAPASPARRGRRELRLSQRARHFQKGL
ncbi:MAG: hypothetical protein M0020_09820 [Actinomycetota bacterium]|nr:hypothetical protein [Actinomycetota bacterium]